MIMIELLKKKLFWKLVATHLLVAFLGFASPVVYHAFMSLSEKPPHWPLKPDYEKWVAYKVPHNFTVEHKGYIHNVSCVIGFKYHLVFYGTTVGYGHMDILLRDENDDPRPKIVEGDIDTSIVKLLEWHETVGKKIDDESNNSSGERSDDGEGAEEIAR